MEAVSLMVRVALDVEGDPELRPRSSTRSPRIRGYRRIPEAIGQAACRVAENVGAAAILAFTQTGSTAALVAKYRPAMPIFAVTPSQAVRRRLASLPGSARSGSISRATPSPRSVRWKRRFSPPGCSRRGTWWSSPWAARSPRRGRPTCSRSTGWAPGISTRSTDAICLTLNFSAREFMTKKAVVLYSGGLDSTTCMAIARARGSTPYAMSFAYGQRHAVELAEGQRVAPRARGRGAPGGRHRSAPDRRQRPDLRYRGAQGRGHRRGRSRSPTCRPATPSSSPSPWAGPRCSAPSTSSSASMPSTTRAIPTAAPIHRRLRDDGQPGHPGRRSRGAAATASTPR